MRPGPARVAAHLAVVVAQGHVDTHHHERPLVRLRWHAVRNAEQYDLRADLPVLRERFGVQPLARGGNKNVTVSTPSRSRNPSSNSADVSCVELALYG